MALIALAVLSFNVPDVSLVTPGTATNVDAAANNTPAAATEIDLHDLEWNDPIAAVCGAPGHGSYHAQARCIGDILGDPGPTSDQGLNTIYRDACTAPSVPAVELPHRLGEVNSTKAFVGLVLTARLARVYCGEGESLDYDGFRKEFKPPPSQPEPSSNQSASQDRYLDTLHRSYPPARNTPESELIVLGETICESLAHGMPLDSVLQRGTRESSPEFIMAAITAANSNLCPDVTPTN